MRIEGGVTGKEEKRTQRKGLVVRSKGFSPPPFVFCCNHITAPQSALPPQPLSFRCATS